MLSGDAARRWPGRVHPLPRDARDTLFILALVLWIMLPQLGRLPLWCSGAVGVIVLWRGVLTLGRRRLPRRWVVLALLIAALAATQLTYGTLLGTDAGVALIMTLLALKTLELRARRDALVVFFLGFFALLTNFFYSQSLPSAIIAVTGLLGLLTALVNANRPTGAPTLGESAAVALRLALVGTPIMVALFLFFPRLAPLWALPSDRPAGQTGLSSSMHVGQVAQLAQDDSIAFRVKFEGPPPRQADLYFRGPVLEQFDGREWTARPWHAGASLPRAAAMEVHGTPIRYATTLEPSQQHWLLTLDGTPTAPRLPPDWVARTGVGHAWRSSRPVDQILRYEAESWPDYRYAATPGELRTDLELPAGFNPRTIALARQLQEQFGADGPQAIVHAALQRLRSGGYRYTLEPGVTGRNSADEFWFDTRLGFCEHIASAFSVLLRAAGVPTRVVTGFQGGARNTIDGYWVVRNSDAHAWTEVWLGPERGWLRVDPTAAVMPARIGADLRLRPVPGFVAGTFASFSPRLLTQARAVWDAINNRWNQWVLNYTEDQQFDLLRDLGFEQPDWLDLARVLGWILAASASAAVAWLLWRRREHDPWRRLLARVRRRLRAAGIDAPAHVPPRELARRVAASNLPETTRAALVPWLIALERVRYAPSGPAPGNLRLATLKRQFRHFHWPHTA